MSIPIQNIYYLLSYAWNLLKVEDENRVAATTGDKVLNLLTLLLYRNTLPLIRQGLTRQFSRQTNTLTTIKGKIDLTATFRNDLLRQGKAICTFEDLSVDVLPNQVIKAIILQLQNTPELASEMQSLLCQLFRSFSQVSTIKLNQNLFTQLPAKWWGNRFYERVLPLCALLYQNLLPEPGGNSFVFVNFLEDERQMAQLFEHFVRNFLKQEQQEFGVKSERISWQTKTETATDLAFLPQMVTDISLLAAHRNIIIDTKYYKQALVRHYDKQKIISSHLYQLFSYLKNHPASAVDSPVEGILLYPVVEQELDLTYQLQGHKISIKTINLAQPWPNIKADLLQLLA